MRSCNCADPTVFGHRCGGYHPEGDPAPDDGFVTAADLSAFAGSSHRTAQAYASSERALREYREALNNRFTLPGSRHPRRGWRLSS